MIKEDFLKLGFTEEQATKAAEASTEELKTYIPKSRFDEVNTAKKKAEDDLKERDIQLTELSKTAGVSEELKKQIETLQTENQTKQAEQEKTIKQMRVDSIIARKLAENGVVKELQQKAVKALLSLENIEFDGDSDIKGLNDQIKALREGEDTKHLLGIQVPPKYKGVNPPEGSGGTPPQQPASMAEAIKLHYEQQEK